MIKLIIAEKPDQAKKYAEALGKPTKKNGVFTVKNSKYISGELRIVSASGHLLSIKNPYKKTKENWVLENLPCIPKKFTYELINFPNNKNYSNRIKSLFETIKKEVASCDEIIIATDSDREGEYIAYSILEEMPKNLNSIKKVTKRLWIGSLTNKSIQIGFQNLKNASETKNLYYEAKARSFADWLVGFNYSPLVTLTTGEKGMNVGRVQTPTVALICSNDTAIRNFVSKPFWRIQAKDENNIIFSNKKLKFFDLDEAKEIYEYIKTLNFIVESVEEEVREKESPKLFELTSLQAYASKRLKITPKEVLDLVSSLYLKTFLTYPRTDISYLTQSEFDYLNENFDKYNKVLKSKVPKHFKESRKRYVDDKKVEQHIAIIPTENIPDLEKLEPLEKEIYKIVTNRTLLMFAPNQKKSETVVTLSTNGVNLTSKFSNVLDYGYTKFELVQKDEKQDVSIPPYQTNEPIKIDFELIEDKTKQPVRVTESMLVKTYMNKYSLGTTATRADIIQNVINNNYISINEKTRELTPTEKAYRLIDFLNKNKIPYNDVQLTSVWEKNLTEIGKGSIMLNEFVKNIENEITTNINEIKDKNILKSIKNQ